MAYDDSVRLIWSLATSGKSTTITTSGDSGPWAVADNGARYSAVDLRWADDIWLSVSAAGGAGSAATVQLDAYDDQGTLFPQLLKVTLAAAPGQAVAFGGRHGGGGSGSYFVLPQWGRISWTLTGSMTGAGIALYAR
jgi:hypothetical protein